MSAPQTPTTPPKYGCLWAGLLVLLVLALIGYGVCSNASFSTR